MAGMARQQKRQEHRQARRTNRQERRAEQHSAPWRPKVALALQGGGSHGAFTWGVLDRLLDETTIDIVGVTGTSAGAMSGALLVDGLLDGGLRRPARNFDGTGKRSVPHLVSAASSPEFLGRKLPIRLSKASLHVPRRCVKTYQPHALSPSNSALHLLLSELIDFNRLRLQKKIQLTICATNARTAKRRVFTNHDASFDVLLASTCLPQYFRAVEIDGEAYWDGGWTGNPALAPLLTKMPDCDLIIVRVDPVSRRELPRSLPDIFHRTLEISQNSTFWLELGALAVVLRFVDERRSPFRRIRFHMIEANPIMEKFPVSSKLNNYPPLLEYLFDLGRQTCDAWISQNGEAVGQRSTMDIQQLLPGNIWDNI